MMGAGKPFRRPPRAIEYPNHARPEAFLKRFNGAATSSQFLDSVGPQYPRRTDEWISIFLLMSRKARSSESC